MMRNVDTVKDLKEFLASLSDDLPITGDFHNEDMVAQVMEDEQTGERFMVFSEA
jgi:hypothetical protein